MVCELYALLKLYERIFLQVQMCIIISKRYAMYNISLFSVIKLQLNLGLIMLYTCKDLFAIASFSIHKNRYC